jgi:hypothetical protein
LKLSTAHANRKDSPEELEERYERSVATSLAGLAAMLEILDPVKDGEQGRVLSLPDIRVSCQSFLRWRKQYLSREISNYKSLEFKEW